VILWFFIFKAWMYCSECGQPPGKRGKVGEFRKSQGNCGLPAVW